MNGEYRQQCERTDTHTHTLPVVRAHRKGEMSGKRIPHPRLEAIPFARYTVECQARIERESGGRGSRRPAAQAFVGFLDDRSGLESGSDND